MNSIPEYYAGKNIFITGATGFIGKVLVEKLLRSCPSIGDIYCLTRPKKGLAAADRLRHMLDEPLYDNLRRDQPDFTRKVHAVPGDVVEEGLGLHDDQRSFLEENIHVVFHSAATVKFDEPLRVAVNMNVLAVRKMVQLCKRFKKLEVFLHVSTAYANCDRHFIEEQVYPPPVEPQKIIDALEWMDDETVSKISSKLIGDKPNTYTYTKHLGEALLVTEGADLPLAIIRPSIVTAAWMEPVPGWVDNWNGPSGIYIAAGKGLLRSMIADTTVIADLVPVDFPVNMMIAVAWARANATKTAASISSANGAAVYHMTTGGLNPFTWGEMENVVVNYFKSNPMESCFRRPKVNILTSNSFLHDLWVLVSHLIPAYAADLGYMLIGKKTTDGENVCQVTQVNGDTGIFYYAFMGMDAWSLGHIEVTNEPRRPENILL